LPILNILYFNAKPAKGTDSMLVSLSAAKDQVSVSLAALGLTVCVFALKSANDLAQEAKQTQTVTAPVASESDHSNLLE